MRFAASISEDDRLRSEHVRVLVQGGSSSAPAAPGIPKVLVQFWDDPVQLPSDVRHCLDSWDGMAPAGFRRILFDTETARRFITEAFGQRHAKAFDCCVHPAMGSDYFRLCYLVKCGGAYVDADECYEGGDFERLFRDPLLKVQPLCYDRSAEVMVPAERFVTPGAFSPDWVFYVANSPLFAPPRHPVLRLALARSTQILLAQGRSPDIHSGTGPGNLTQCLVRHSLTQALAGRPRDFGFIVTWDAVSRTEWQLSYRGDGRNWRRWHPSAEPAAVQG